MNEIDGTENVLIGNWHARLPSAICTDPAIFNSIFSIDTWENVLGTEAKQRILQMLPKEILSCQGLAVKTIQDLLSGDLSRFSTTPLETFFNQLDGGLFEPSVVPTREAIKKVWRKDSKRIIKKRQIKVLQELLVSTTKYLDEKFPLKDVHSNSNGVVLRDSVATKPSKDSGHENSYSRTTSTQPTPDGPGLENDLQRRTRKRYFEELSEINTQGNCASSDDDEFPVLKKPTLNTRSNSKESKKEFLSIQKFEAQLEKQPDRRIHSGVVVNCTGSQAFTGQHNANTRATSIAPVKPGTRPATLKSREEQTAAQMAKFPKILPAPSVVSPTEDVKSVDGISSKTPTASTSSQFKSSPLLASQLQAPIISNHKHSSQSDILLANRVLQMQSNASSSFSHSSFDMDDMESSSDDEFESIEPTIGFGSKAPLSGQRSYSNKSGMKGSKAAGRNIQSNAKSKNKTHKQTTLNTKSSTAVPNIQGIGSAPSTSSSIPPIVSTNSGALVKVSSQSGAIYPGPIVVGLTSSTATSTTSGVGLQPPPIILTSVSANSNPINPPFTSSSVQQVQPRATSVPPTIKLTPGLVSTTLGTNKLLSALTPGPGFTSDANTSTTARLYQPGTSLNITNTVAANPGTSNVFLLNGPAKNQEATHNGSPKNLPVYRIQGNPNAQGHATNMTSRSPNTSKQNLVTSRLSGSLGLTMTSPITLQDLNFSLNADGNVVQTNSTERKFLSDSAEDKMDDLSGLEGNPFDSILPNLSDDLDGFDLDLVEVCDFHSLVSEEKHYASFFSLIRDVLCSTKDHRMTFICLEKTIRKWSISPSASSNTWFTRVCDWNEALITALNFLAGNYQDAHPEDFVPYIEYKYKTKYYQWIGAGRDSDNNMLPLCNMWLENLGRLPPIKKLEAEPDEPEEDDEDNEDSDSPDVEVKKKPKRPITPPPPRCVTSWTVRPSNDDERDSFQEQEHQRFENPHKAFTYRMHDYESVVGPVKGVYSSQSGVTNKARGHSLLIDDRPPYVTILALVRDAVARLPNGEGTRSEICEMLRDSAFLAPEASNVTLNSVVSGALDRLHYERDPCVRYDSHKKSWIYLHRDRNQEQFERLHHNRSYTKSTKSRSNTARKVRKHNKSTSSSGSQSHGQATPSSSSSPTTIDQSKSTSTTANVSTVKLPPIETMFGKSGNNNIRTHTTSGQQVQADNKPISTPVSLPQAGTSAYPVISPTPGTSTTLLAAQLNKPIITTSASSGVTSISMKSTPTSMNSISTSSIQATQLNVSTGQIMLGPNVVRFGGPVRFSSLRVPGAAGAAGIRVSPRIVLRGGIPTQNQGLIVGQTPDGQTVFLQASPGGAVGTMQVQLASSAPAQSQLANQPIAVTARVSGPASSVSTLTPGNPTTLPAVALIQSNNKVVLDANVLRTSQMGMSKLQPRSTVSNLINVMRSQAAVGVAQNSLTQVSTPLTPPNTVAGAQTSPILIKSSQGNFIVPARIYGPGPVGEFKMVPISGTGNQTVYARIVPQSSSDLSTSTPSAPTIRFITTASQATTTTCTPSIPSSQ